MKVSALVKVDSKGRVTIPQTIRDLMGIEPGMLMAVIADIEKKEIAVSPIYSSGRSIYEINLDLKDRPGAIASVTSLLARHNVNIIATRCTTIMRGEEGNCIIVADFSMASEDVEVIRRQLEDLEMVIQVNLKKFEGATSQI